MEFLKQINKENDVFSIVDIYNKKKYQVSKYFEFLCSKNIKKKFLAEVPLFPSPLIVDVDISEEEKNQEIRKLYDEKVIQEIILSYTKVLDDILSDKPKSYKILLLEKPAKIKNGFIKNGFHLHFISISLSKEDLKKVFVLTQEVSEYSDYLDDVSQKNWLLYGSCKSPEEDPYLITRGYEVTDENLKIVDNYKTFFYGEKYFNILLEESNTDELMKAIMSIRNVKNFSLTKPNKIDYLKLPKNLDPLNKEILNSPVKTHINISSEKIAEIIMTLNDSRAENYNQWIEIAFIITSIAKSKKDEDERDFLKGIFHTFSRKSSKYNDVECENKWNNLMKSNYEGGLGIGSLIYMAKEDGNFLNLKEIVCNFSLQNIPVNDYDIANMVKSSITQIYITHKDHGCFKLDITAFKEVSGWDSIFKNHIKEWFEFYIKKINSKLNSIQTEIKELQKEGDEDSKNNLKQLIEDFEISNKTINKLEKKVKNYSSLNNITKSLFDLYFDEKLINLFEQKNNLLAFKNCVFDFENWRFISGDPNHYILNRLEHEIIDWKNVPEENKEIVFDFFNKIFPDKQVREYFLRNMAVILTGQNTFKQFQFWTGSGHNGKSICISLFEFIFGKMSMKIPKTMVTGVQQKQGGTNPELFRLKDARIAIVDEVTNNDILDPGQIKGLTGNDKLYGRDLYQRSKEIKEIIPMFIPILITNEIPIIKHPDGATWNRIRLIKFESIFTNNVEEYIKTNKSINPNNVFKRDPKIYNILKENAKYFLSFLMDILLRYDSLKDFNQYEFIPDKVNEGLEIFKQNQNILRQFLEENYIVDEKSIEIISANKMLKEYTNTRPKIQLTLEELVTALKNYKIKHPEIIITEDNKIKGLSKVEF